VPAGVTVAGIPARPIERKRERANFVPYGTPIEAAIDPLLRDLESLRAELTEVEARLGAIAAEHQSSPVQPGTCEPAE